MPVKTIRIKIDTNDFLGLLNSGSTLSVIEINGNHIEDMMQELAKHPCSSNPLQTANYHVYGGITMKTEWGLMA
jgi:hypothetical protein